MNEPEECGITPLPTAVPLPIFNITIPNAIKGSTSAPPCLSGTSYTAMAGDSCATIARAKSVNSGTLRVINNLLPDCSNLKTGMQLCLPRPCKTHVVQATDTCESIAIANGVSDSLLVGHLQHLSHHPGAEYRSVQGGLDANRPGQDLVESDHQHRVHQY